MTTILESNYTEKCKKSIFLRKVKVTQSCPTLCYSTDYTVHGILQARMLEWVAFPFSRDLPNPGIKPRAPAWQAILYQLSHKGSPRILEGVAYPFSRLTVASWPAHRFLRKQVRCLHFYSFHKRFPWRHPQDKHAKQGQANLAINFEDSDSLLPMPGVNPSSPARGISCW